MALSPGIATELVRQIAPNDLIWTWPHPMLDTRARAAPAWANRTPRRKALGQSAHLRGDAQGLTREARAFLADGTPQLLAVRRPDAKPLVFHLLEVNDGVVLLQLKSGRRDRQTTDRGEHRI